MDRLSYLKNALREMSIASDERKLKKLMEFMVILTEANKTMNLIGPVDGSGLVKKHILDSLAPLAYGVSRGWNQPDVKILDIGSGGGFPGIPISIFLEEANVVLIDKSVKKSEYLRHAADRLSLKNVTVLTGRAEELVREAQWRENFDVVFARAVAKFDILLELSIPFCNINGKIIFYKSKKVFSEMKESSSAINILGGRVEKLIKVDIPGLEEFRALLVVDKEKSTPKKFPRKFSRIKKRPL